MLQDIFDKYLEVFPDERLALKRLQQQVAANESLNNRKNFRGHIAGDGIVLSPDHTKFLMIHHNVYNRWMQPGGHWDLRDSDPLAAARREVTEETGLEKVKLIEWLPGHSLVPIDITVDDVPENPQKKEPRHFHYTFAYLFEAQTLELHHQPEEVSAAKWATFAQAVEPEGSHYSKIINKLERFKVA